MEIDTEQTLPGAAAPYVVRAGRGLRHLVAGEVVHTLAGVGETAGGFGVLTCDAPLSRAPIPMHYHEREYDTWLCTRGKLQVWCRDQSRILRPGDFGYVKPFDTHSYRSMSPRMSFFGIVAPGGWEQFMADAGEVWGMTALPPADRPFDFSRMGPAMAMHDVHRVADPVFVDAADMSEADQRLPDDGSSYFLEAGYGARHSLLGHLSTALLTTRQCDGKADVRTIEAGRNTAMPLLRHDRTTSFLYVVSGALAVTLDGEPFRLTEGDGANIPAGCAYSTRVLSGSARWVSASAGGDGAALWERAGREVESFAYPMEVDGEAELGRLAASGAIDVVMIG